MSDRLPLPSHAIPPIDAAASTQRSFARKLGFSAEHQLLLDAVLRHKRRGEPHPAG